MDAHLEPVEAPVVSDREALDRQQAWWNTALSQNPAMFGNEPSEPAKKAAELFSKAGVGTVLELGAGAGRDTKLFALHGFKVCAVDYSTGALGALEKKLQNLGLSDSVETVQHDIRQPLPFPDASFDACYSHMLFCMALSDDELKRLSLEIRRILEPGGLCVYTVRHTGDSHYGAGKPRGGNLYEMNGFIVHYFDLAKIERLAEGYEILDVADFEEGSLPRRLFRVTLKKRP